jgi:dihydroorotase
LAAEKSLVNYSFFFGATHTNTGMLEQLDPHKVCGVKLFMGSSTGNMLVDREDALRAIFSRSPLLIMTHCEDSSIISANLKSFRERYGDDPDVKYHPAIRNEEACFRSTELAVKLARETGARLHVAHVSTARELSLFRRDPLWDETTGRMKPVTAEACIAHLFYTDADYARLGTRIKCNPAIKSGADRAALRQALTDGRIDVIGTDHAPHLPVEKEGGCVKAASGMPMVQFSLVSMLRLSDEGVLPVERVVDLMCHAPARLFQIKGRGFLREGAQADLVLLRPSCPWTLRREDILSRCGWSPLEGERFNWSVEQTYCNGHLVYNHGHIDTDVCGRQLTFDR